MKTLSTLFVLLMAPLVHAQELGRVEDQAQDTSQVSVEASSASAVPATSSSAAVPVVSALSTATAATSPSIQKRKQRQELEVKTEYKIVEKLEDARLEDERNRADQVISKGFSSQRSSPTHDVVVTAPVAAPPVVQQVPAQVVTAPVQIQAPAPIGKIEDSGEKIDIKSEIRTAVEELNKKNVDLSTYYISGQMGLGKYPDVINVRGNVSTGVTVGVVTPERMVFEGSFLYGNYDIEDLSTSSAYLARIVDLRQYNVGASLKFQLLPGKLRPNIGAIVSYTHRSMNENDVEFRSSEALDAGIATGIDLALTDSFAIGFDFRYLTNLTFRERSDRQQSFVYQTSLNPIEKLDYYVGSLSGKFTF